MSEQNPGQELREMAKKYLNEEIMPSVIDSLVAGDHDTVRVQILGAVDHLFSDEQIDGAEASATYQKLGIPPKAMFRIRTSAKNPK